MLTLTENKTRVKINNSLSEEFDIGSGAKQGDPLSATLFSLIIDSVIKKLDLRGNIST